MVTIVIGAGILVILLIWQIQKWTMYEAIMAKCSGISMGTNRGGGIVTKRSRATYIYTYGEQEYVFEEKWWFGNPKRQAGEMHKIHVRKNKPWKCITSEENTTAAYELALGIMLVLGGLISF